MGTVLLDISMSLDGFIAQANDASGPIHDWFFTGDVVNEHNNEFKTLAESRDVLDETMETTGAVIVGRRTYSFVDGWGGSHPIAGVPVFVVTHRAPSSVPEGATPFTFATDGVGDAVSRAREAAGEKIVVVMGGASIAQQCLSAGLLDEIQIHLAPVVLGRGVRLFPAESFDTVALVPTRVVDAPDVTHLRYRVEK